MRAISGCAPRGIVAGACALALFFAVASAADAQAVGQVAQVGTIGGIGGGVTLEAPPVATGRPNVFAPAGRAEDALVLGNWLIYPSAFGGFIYDSNVNQTPGGKGSAGLRVAPAFVAEDDNDLFKTTLYGDADIRDYFSDIPDAGTDIEARAGGTETYTPLPDLTINGQADFTRQKDLFSTLGTEQSVTSLNPTGVGLAPTASPIAYNQYTAAASVQKNFTQSFVSFGGSAVDIVYDQVSGTPAPSPNGTVFTGVGRGGFWITPALYGYLEGSGDSRDYSVSALSSTGYRAVAGLGTDQIGLLRGEVYAGYQAETYNTSGIGTVGSPVYGVRGYYYPLPELTINLAIDEELGASLETATAGSPNGTSTKLDTALLTADYTLGRQWSASGRAGFIRTDYIGATRTDNAWTVGGTVTYNLLRNVGLTLDYQHIELASNVSDQGFARDVVTIGLTYKY